MARTLQDAKLDTRAARLRLKRRREPYWRSLSEGLAVGYRRGTKGGTWIARHYSTEHGRRFYAIGTADGTSDADGTHILSFAQAQEAACGERHGQDAAGNKKRRDLHKHRPPITQTIKQTVETSGLTQSHGAP